MRKLEFIGKSSLFGQQWHITPEETVFINGDNDLPAFIQLKEKTMESVNTLIKSVNEKAKFSESRFVENIPMIELVETAYSDNCDFIQPNRRYKIIIQEIL